MVSELFKTFPRQLAELYYPLVFKSLARLDPPLQWRGGMLHELFKGKGDPGIPSTYRDVLLADDDGKALFKIIRTAVFPLASSLVSGTQFGSGFSGGECAIAHLAVQIFIDYARETSTSSSLLFVDLIQAFASMIRKVCLRDPSGDEQWLIALRSAGFPEDEIKIGL